jgi:hypothetical protein
MDSKAFVLRIMSSAKGDDNVRAHRAFQGMTSEELKREHGQSGKTRAEILAEYEDQDKQFDEAIEWVKQAY